MDSEFTAEKTRRLIEVILQAMKEGWSPGSDAANDGAWKDKGAEARFASAFKELLEPDTNNITTVVETIGEIQQLSSNVFCSMRKRGRCRHVAKTRGGGARIINSVDNGGLAV